MIILCVMGRNPFFIRSRISTEKQVLMYINDLSQSLLHQVSDFYIAEKLKFSDLNGSVAIPSSSGLGFLPKGFKMESFVFDMGRNPFFIRSRISTDVRFMAIDQQCM